MVNDSSRARARTWPYPRHQEFEKELRKVASAWFKDKGFAVSARHPYILADREKWSQNIILPEVAAYIREEQAMLKPGQAQQFTAAVIDTASNVTSFEPTWTTTGGDISAEGVYTAGDVEGSYEVMARVPGTDLVGMANVLVRLEPPPPPPPPPGTLRLKMRLNRQQLYQSFNAIGNLAEKAGAIRMTVEAEAEEGFDPVWLRNAVLEPLEEADIEIEEER